METRPEQIYGSQKQQSWTRIGMLLTLYDAGIASVDGALEALQAGNDDDYRHHRMKSIRIVLGIAAGLDMKYGEVPASVARLCEFMHHSLMEGGQKNLEAARDVLQTLRSAYDDIRPAAIQLEADGEIPPVSLNNTMEVTV